MYRKVATQGAGRNPAPYDLRHRGRRGSPDESLRHQVAERTEAAVRELYAPSRLCLAKRMLNCMVELLNDDIGAGGVQADPEDGKPDAGPRELWETADQLLIAPVVGRASVKVACGSSLRWRSSPRAPRK